MSISFAPPAVIFISNNLVPQVEQTLQTQLFINQTMDGYTFDQSVLNVPGFIQSVYANNLRILVERQIDANTPNTNLADVVLFAPGNGMVSVKCNKLGPPEETLAIARLYWTNLIDYNKYLLCCQNRCCDCNNCCSPCCGDKMCCSNSIYNEFKGVGEACYPGQFNPSVFSCPIIIEPVDE